jgi:seryl-tRNA synthetase
VSETKRLTAEQLARFRADYHECGKTVVPLLDEIDALTAERDEARAEVARLQRQVEGHCERIFKQSELLSKRAEKGSEPLTAERDRLRALLLAACGQHPEAVLTDGDTSCTLAHLARRLEGS